MRKDNSIKTIPAFTPIPSADNLTPDSTPEKRVSLPGSISKPEVKLERIKNRAERKHKVSSSSDSNSNKIESNLQMSTGAKFTTANFTETVVTQSSGPLFASEKGCKSKKSADSVYSFSSDSEHGNSDSNTVMKYEHSPDHDSDSTKDSPSDDATFSPKTTVCNNISSSSQSPSVSFKSIFENYANGNRQEPIVESDILSGISNKKAKTEKADKKKLKKVLASKQKNNSTIIKVLGMTPPRICHASMEPMSAIRYIVTGENTKENTKATRMISETNHLLQEIRVKNKITKEKSVSSDPRPESPVNTPSSPPRKTKKRKESQILQNGFASSSPPHSPPGPRSPPLNGPSILSSRPVSSVSNIKPLNSISPSVHQPQVSPYSHILTASNHITPSVSAENSLPSSHLNHVLPPRLSSSTSRFPTNNINSSNQVPPPPHSLEQLLERQWEQGSQFLMEQSAHFDIASLLSCLNQLRSENQKLEEHVSSLLVRREHLLLVNARLSVPLNVTNSNQEAQPSRINNFIPSDTSLVCGLLFMFTVIFCLAVTVKESAFHNKEVLSENNAFNRGLRSPAAGSSVNSPHVMPSHQSNLAHQHQSSSTISNSHGNFIQPSLPSPGSMQRPSHISNQQFSQQASISQGPTLSYGLQNSLVPPTHHDIASSSLLPPVVPLLLSSHPTTADSPLLPPPFSSDVIRQAINSQHAALVSQLF
ncbi:hypothetical protein GQR58_016531 [Nymphon striatum]|nr:hypothetical protein GQR58_016531 [Nymphon striatum]